MRWSRVRSPPGSPGFQSVSSCRFWLIVLTCTNFPLFEVKCFQLFPRDREISLADDVVAQVNGFCSMTADGHCDLSGNPGSLHVSDCGAAKVMEQQVWNSGRLS